MKKLVINGIYQHFKTKNFYKVIGVAKHSETLEELVVYQGQYENNPLWVRPLENFLSDVERDGKTQERFHFTGEIKD